ncbi:MAG: FlgB family protein [Pseudomonadota bacterium]
MFADLNVFKMAYAMATHAGTRQAVVSRNMANADTPGYQAKDIAPFAAVYGQQIAETGMRASRAGHFNADKGDQTWPEFVADGPSDPNGNSVSLEIEMVRAVDVKRQHDRAVAIYKSSLNVLRTSLGRA